MEKLILECVVRSVSIAFCTAVALYVLRVKAARLRHAVWASVMVLMLVLPAWTAWGPKAEFRLLTAPSAVTVAQSAVVEQITTDQVAPALLSRRVGWSWRNSLLILYLLGFCALMARLTTGTVRARMLVRRAGNRAGRLTSESCVTPITVGWLRPSVILPRGWTQWSMAELKAVLAHEDEHVRRRDPLVQWLALLNRAVFWFHPLAWWLERRLSGLAEEACDDAVLMGGHDPVQYSECLLGLARVVRESGARVGVVGMAMPGTFLPQRIRRIVAGAPLQRVSRGRIVSVGLACAVVFAVFTVGTIGYAAPAVWVVARTVASDVAAPTEVAQPLLNSRGTAGVVRTKRVVPAQSTVLLAQATAALASPDSTPTGQSFSGVVVDPSGAVVANAPVLLTKIDTGPNFLSITDSTGNYRFQNIETGTYKLTLRVPGFKTETQMNIVVAAGEAHNGGRTILQLGLVSHSVTVTGSRSAATSTPFVGILGPMTTVPEGVRNVVVTPLRPQPPARGPADPPNTPVRVGGNVQAVRLLRPIKPVYPPELQQAGIQGTVKFEAVITKDGGLSDIHVISVNMDSRLIQTALDAVNQWKYQPTLLDGQPVEVLTTIDMNFALVD